VYSAVGAGDAAASPSKKIGQNLLNLGKFGWIRVKLRRNLGKIEAKFEQK